MHKRLVWIVLLAGLLAGCAGSAPATATSTPAPTRPTATRAAATATATPRPGVTLAPTRTAARTATAKPAEAATPAASGPDSYPAGVNPLTGLRVAEADSLRLPPALISITNSPVTARPQMGLSDAAWVFELWIGEGVTRFLAVFYGDLPGQGLDGEEAAIGPIRSGRLPYEPLRQLLHGFVMMAFASKWVTPNLDYYHNVINEDLLTDINGAHTHVSEVRELAGEYQKVLGEPRLQGLRFDPRPPAGGVPGESVFMPWSFNTQVWWHYDPAGQAYTRWQDEENGGKSSVQAVDRLTGEPLAFENLVVLFAEHTAYRPELIAVNFYYIKKLPALVFRDGQMYSVYWTTASESYERKTGRFRPIRFVDAQGKPFPLKPGQTWLAVMSLGSPYYETVDSRDYLRLATQTAPGSGIWAVRYAVPEPLETPWP